MPAPDFVEALVADLVPVRPAAPFGRAMLLWVVISWASVGATILATGPMRDGVLDQILHSPQFAAELALGWAAGIAMIWAGLELGVPGGSSSDRPWSPPAIAFAAWTLIVAYGVFSPGVPPSMIGKRVDCFVEIVIASLPPLALALYLLAGRILYLRSATGFLVGAAAAAIPALWMHLACQAGSGHVLTHHFPPIFLVAAASAIIAPRVLSRV